MDATGRWTPGSHAIGDGQQLGCGCWTFKRWGDKYTIAWCPLHANVNEIAEALETLIRRIERDNLHTTHGVQLEDARAALRKARGEKE